MADLKRKQLRQFLSGSFNITGSLNVTGSVEFDKNISGSITSTGSFSRLQSDTISVTHSPFASGSGVQALMDATGSYASASTQYVKESQTGSFGSGSDVQGILDTYVRQSESSSFASGSDLQVILAESASYVVESETGSFASGSDFHQILAESSSYVVESETGSFLQNADSASFSSLDVVGNISSSLTSTGSFGSLVSPGLSTLGIVSATSLDADGGVTIDNITIDGTEIDLSSGDLTLDVEGNIILDANGAQIRLEDNGTEFGRFSRVSSDLVIKSISNNNDILLKGVDGSSTITALQLDMSEGGDAIFSGGVSASLGKTGSFDRLEGITLNASISPFASGSDVSQIQAQTGSYASGSDLHQILAESSSYVTQANTGSYLQQSDTASFQSLGIHNTLFVSGNIITSGSVVAEQYIVNSSVTNLTQSFSSGSTIFGDTTDDKHRFTGSIEITSSLLTIDSVGGVSGSLTSTASFGTLELVDVTGLPFATGSDLHQILAESSSYVLEQETGSFASGSDLQVILAESSSYVTLDETGSFASGSDLQIIQAESASYVVSTNTGSFVVNSQTGSFSSGSDLQVILAESSSYVTLDETGSFASGSDLHQFLAESASYLNNNSTSSLGKLTLVSDITSSITSTGSFGRVDVAENTFILGNLGIGTSTQGNRLQVAGDATIVGGLDTLGSVSGGLTSTGSFARIEELGVKVVNSNQTASFASGSDLHAILAESSSYMMSDQTGSMGTTSISSTLTVVGDISTSGSVIAREFKTEFVSSSIIFASGSQIFGDSEDDTHAFSGSVNIGDMVFSGSRVGVSSDLDLLTLSDDTLTINGGIVIMMIIHKLSP